MSLGTPENSARQKLFIIILLLLLLLLLLILLLLLLLLFKSSQLQNFNAGTIEGKQLTASYESCCVCYVP